LFQDESEPEYIALHEELRVDENEEKERLKKE
jgi:hypothetical protein